MHRSPRPLLSRVTRMLGRCQHRDRLAASRPHCCSSAEWIGAQARRIADHGSGPRARSLPSQRYLRGWNTETIRHVGHRRRDTFAILELMARLFLVPDCPRPSIGTIACPWSRGLLCTASALLPKLTKGKKTSRPETESEGRGGRSRATIRTQ